MLSGREIKRPNFTSSASLSHLTTMNTQKLPSKLGNDHRVEQACSREVGLYVCMCKFFCSFCFSKSR